MTTVNMHEAKTHLSKLVEKAVHGESFIIARAGKPLVKVTAIAPEPKAERRVGFMEGHAVLPDNIKDFYREEIEAMFGLND